MGVSVREKPSGSGVWWIFVNHNGRRKSKRVGRDKKTAVEAAKQIEAKLVLGDLKIDDEQAPCPTFQEYAEKWLATYVKVNCKETTQRNYAAFLRMYLYPVFGKKHLDQIRRADVKDYILERLSCGLSASTVLNHKACLSGIFTSAVEDELIVVNPASGTGRLIKRKNRRDDINPLTREEARLFLDTAREHFPRAYPLFLVSLRTGLRIGEVTGLQWGDIDFNGRFIEVRRSIVNGKITTPKNRKSRRVDMSNQLTESLRILKTERKKETLRSGWKEIPPWVFITSTGNYIDSNNLRKQVFDKCLDKAGLRRIRIHDLRHSYASFLIMQGESLAYVRDQLGHHSIQLTVDTYGHLEPGKNRQAVDKLDDAFDDPIDDSMRDQGAHPAAPYTHPAKT